MVGLKKEMAGSSEIQKAQNLLKDKKNVEEVFLNLADTLEEDLSENPEWFSDKVVQNQKALDQGLKDAAQALSQIGLWQGNQEKFLDEVERSLQEKRATDSVAISSYINNLRKWTKVFVENIFASQRVFRGNTEALKRLYSIVHDLLLSRGALFDMVNDMVESLAKEKRGIEVKDPQSKKNYEKNKWFAEEGLDKTTTAIRARVQKILTKGDPDKTEGYLRAIKEIEEETVLPEWNRIKRALKNNGFSSTGEFYPEIFERKESQIEGLKLAAEVGTLPYTKDLRGFLESYKKALDHYRDNPKKQESVINTFHLIALDGDNNMYSALRNYYEKVPSVAQEHQGVPEEEQQGIEDSIDSRDLSQRPTEIAGRTLERGDRDAVRAMTDVVVRDGLVPDKLKSKVTRIGDAIAGKYLIPEGPIDVKTLSVAYVFKGSPMRKMFNAILGLAVRPSTPDEDILRILDAEGKKLPSVIKIVQKKVEKLKEERALKKEMEKQKGRPVLEEEKKSPDTPEPDATGVEKGETSKKAPGDGIQKEKPAKAKAKRKAPYKKTPVKIQDKEVVPFLEAVKEKTPKGEKVPSEDVVTLQEVKERLEQRIKTKAQGVTQVEDAAESLEADVNKALRELVTSKPEDVVAYLEEALKETGKALNRKVADPVIRRATVGYLKGLLTKVERSLGDSGADRGKVESMLEDFKESLESVQESFAEEKESLVDTIESFQKLPEAPLLTKEDVGEDLISMVKETLLTTESPIKKETEEALEDKEETSPPYAKKETPTEEKPVEETPTEEKPVEEKPVEEKPVEEKPSAPTGETYSQYKRGRPSSLPLYGLETALSNVFSQIDGPAVEKQTEAVEALEEWVSEHSEEYPDGTEIEEFLPYQEVKALIGYLKNKRAKVPTVDKQAQKVLAALKKLAENKELVET